MSKQHSKRGDYETEEIEDMDLSDEEDAKISTIVEANQKEIEDCRVNFRWQKEPLAMVKKVAQSIGVPYQTYMKMSLYNQALADWQQINASTQSATVTQAAGSMPNSTKVSEQQSEYRAARKRGRKK